MIKNNIFFPSTSEKDLGKIKLKNKYFYWVFSFMFIFFLSLFGFLIWSIRTQEQNKIILRENDKSLVQKSATQEEKKQASVVKEIQQLLALDKEKVFIDARHLFQENRSSLEIYFLALIQNLNKEASQKAKLHLPSSVASSPKNIRFPYKYTVTGRADTSFEQLSQIFYGNTEDAFYLSSENGDSLFRSLKKGDEIVLPPPNLYPSLSLYESYMDIPHFSHKADEIIDATGAIHGTPEEIEFFVRVVVAESSPSWDYQGFRMIAESITNRVRLTGHSLWEILTAYKQYDVVSGYQYLQVKVSSLQRQAAMDALKQQNNQFLPKDVIFFATREAVERTPWFQRQKLYLDFHGVLFFSPATEEDSKNILEEAPSESIPEESLSESSPEESSSESTEASEESTSS